MRASAFCRTRRRTGVFDTFLTHSTLYFYTSSYAQVIATKAAATIASTEIPNLSNQIPAILVDTRALPAHILAVPLAFHAVSASIPSVPTNLPAVPGHIPDLCPCTHCTHGNIRSIRSYTRCKYPPVYPLYPLTYSIYARVPIAPTEIPNLSDQIPAVLVGM